MEGIGVREDGIGNKGDDRTCYKRKGGRMEVTGGRMEDGRIRMEGVRYIWEGGEGCWRVGTGGRLQEGGRESLKG